MLLEASDPEIFAVKVEVDFYFETEEVYTRENTLNFDAIYTTAELSFY